MMNKNLLLLKTLLLSADRLNIYKHSRDRKKRRKIISGFIGSAILYVMLVSYSIAICAGYAKAGLIGDAPVMCALAVSALAFVFTLFQTNGYLFSFKEYDMLMSLPFETHTMAGCRFLYMYIKNLPWYLCISLAMLAGYGYYVRPPFMVYPLWILLSFFLPVIPMLFSAFLGFLTAKVSSGFRRTNLIQTILTFCFVLFFFFIRFIIESVFRNEEVTAVLEKTSEVTGNVARIYLPAGWFSDAVTKGNVLSASLLAGVSALLFAALFRVVGRSYRQINSALRSHAAAKNYKMTVQKKRSVVNAIAFKEFRRLTGSTTYMVNGALGEVLAALTGIITLILGADRIIDMVTQGAPINAVMLRPAIPFIIYFFIGMMATTACSPSLEGKNYWILKSLPIEMKTVYQGKMLFNMYLTVPFMAFATLCLCISARVPAVDALLYLVLGFALCAFSTAWGCVCGIRHMRLDWENDVEVIKHGSAVTVYLLPNMFVVMGLVVLAVFLGTRVDQKLMTLGSILIASVLAALSYLRVMALSKQAE